MDYRGIPRFLNVAWDEEGWKELVVVRVREESLSDSFFRDVVGEGCKQCTEVVDGCGNFMEAGLFWNPVDCH